MKTVSTKTIEVRVHSFYCDECGKYLGTSEEFDDGYFASFGDLLIDIYVGNRYILKKCLCEDCTNKLREKIKLSLIELGFKEDN